MKFADRVKQVTSTTGVGAYAINAEALPGFATFAGSFSDSDEVGYCVSSADAYEVGKGTLTGSGLILLRTEVLCSSNSGNAVDWAEGDKDIFCTVPSSVFAGGTDLAQLRTGLLFLLDTTVDGSGHPLDKLGAFTFTKQGDLTIATEASGPLAGRPVYELNGTDAYISAEDIEELRITSNMTIATWLYLDSAADLDANDYFICGCSAAGDSYTTNSLYDVKLNKLVNPHGSFYWFQEYDGGDNSSFTIDGSAMADKGKWIFLVAAREGHSLNLSIFKDSAWTHTSGAASMQPTKSGSNTQHMNLYTAYTLSAPWKGKSGGFAMWSRSLSRAERVALKEQFFQLC